MGEVPQNYQESGQEHRDADRQNEKQRADPTQRGRDLGEDAFAVMRDDCAGVVARLIYDAAMLVGS